MCIAFRDLVKDVEVRRTETVVMVQKKKEMHVSIRGHTECGHRIERKGKKVIQDRGKMLNTFKEISYVT